MDETLHAMEQDGGSFVRQLAKLYRVADSDNQRILRHAFGALFSRYAEIAVQDRARRARRQEDWTGL